MRREGEWLNYFRKFHSFLPFYPSTYKKASAILAGYQHTVNDLPRSCYDRVVEFSEGGIYPKDYPERSFEEIKKGEKKPLTILFVGRMVPFKQPEVLIQCFANSKILKAHRLVMVGDGPELYRLQALCKEKNIKDCVTFTGTINANEVREWMYKADIFGFPSIREQGGGVITMASMSSMPSVVVNYGGPAKRVPEGCGVRVELNDAEKLTKDFQLALESLVSKPIQIKKMGKRARKFTKRFYDWDWKAKKTREIYDWVLKRQTNKPDFWEPKQWY
jgi:glycosyltransferase involved in cell wall biosynthesis